MDKILRFAYFNPKSPVYLGSLREIYKYLKKLRPAITYRKTREFLNKQATYTLHKPIKRRFLRNKTVPIGIDTDWQCDLIDVSNIKKYNNNNTFILTVIDVFSKFAWAVPLKNKTADEIIRGFNRILKSGARHCWVLYHDAGSEFTNKKFKTFLHEKNIFQHVARNTETKASVVERFNRSLTELMWKFFHQKNTFNYTKVLPLLIKRLNNRFHRTIGMKPSEVTMADERLLWNKLYGHLRTKTRQKFTFKIGDKVRISHIKKAFSKAYKPKFTSEIFTVSKCLNRNPPVYEIVDSASEPIYGVFYAQELLKAL